MHGAAHHEILRSWVERGYPPTPSELAVALAATPADVDAALARLADSHGVVLHPGTGEVWIAHPFSAAPTTVWVEPADGRGWWAPCVWCAMGVIALAAPDAVIHARAGGEADPMQIRVDGGARIAPASACVHVPLPARDAWTGVVHWCQTVQPFRSAADVPAWAARHRLPVGAIVPVEQALALGTAWYGRHLDRDWRKWSLSEARRIFAAVGLVGDTWRLPDGEGTF